MKSEVVKDIWKFHRPIEINQVKFDSAIGHDYDVLKCLALRCGDIHTHCFFSPLEDGFLIEGYCEMNWHTWEIEFIQYKGITQVKAAWTGTYTSSNRESSDIFLDYHWMRGREPK